MTKKWWPEQGTRHSRPVGGEERHQAILNFRVFLYWDVFVFLYSDIFVFLCTLSACILVDSCISKQDEHCSSCFEIQHSFIHSFIEQQPLSDLLFSQSFERLSSCLLLCQMLTYMRQNRVNCSFSISLKYLIIWFPFKRSRNFHSIFKFSVSYKSQKSTTFVGKCAQISMSLPPNFVAVQKV